MMSYGAPTLHDMRDDLLAEVMALIWIFETRLHQECPLCPLIDGEQLGQILPADEAQDERCVAKYD